MMAMAAAAASSMVRVTPSCTASSAQSRRVPRGPVVLQAAKQVLRLGERRLSAERGASWGFVKISADAVNGAVPEGIESESSKHVGSVSRETKHDVFLNHRGPDTKKTFVSHLKKELRRAGCDPFLDVKSLVKGQHAFHSINEALAGVLVHVAIFSPRYAESKYCLDELCEMLEGKKPLIPIFYDVEPKDLHCIEGQPFAEALDKHLRQGRGGDVVRWKAALLQAAKITGFRRCNYADDSELVEEVVAAVLENLPAPPQLPPAGHPVGLEETSAQVIHMLHKMEGSVRVVGICGMGGIGKTTLARHVYNLEQPSFENCSFLKDVKEVKGDAVKNLQVKMLKDLAKEDAFDSSSWYARIRNRRVLLVIDDISEEKQFGELVPDLNQLGPGSEVLITSRNKDVLNKIMKDIPQGEIYQVPELSYGDSLQLLTWCAFQRNNLDGVDASFHNYVKDIVVACDGLPLALEVMGGYLAHKKNLPDDEKYWNEAIYALRTKKEIISKLRISYESLEDNDCKHMFLDIACFMLGHEREVAMEVWKSRDEYRAPNWTLEQLIDRSLIKEDVDGHLSMHDLLRDMGRNIIMEKAGGNAEMYSHVWNPEIAAKLLRKRQVSNEVLRALSVNGTDPHIACEAEAYTRLMELKYLCLDGYGVKGNFTQWSAELAWLQWRFFPDEELPSSLKLLNVAVLDLAHSHNLLHLWPGEFETEIPFRDLRVLILDDCYKLKGLPQNISKLVYLKLLRLKDCLSLDSLPDSFSELLNLQEMDLSRCRNIQKLPPSVCGLKKLRVLKVRCSALVQLPEDFGQLQSLTEVDFHGCKDLVKLPDSFSELSSLERLDLSWCKNLQKLPPSVCGLKKLRVLDMSYSALVQLPEDFGQLQSLTEVYFTGCKHLEKLPDSFSELSNLERLDLSWCKNLQKSPRSVCGLKKLRLLNMSYSSLVQLPEDFGQLQSLTEIDFHGCKDLVKLPDSFSELSNLERLDLSYCKNLRMLPPVCGQKKLKVLDMSYSALVQLPEDFGQLQSLTEVDFHGCKDLVKLPDSFSELSSLERLDLSWCKNLQKLPPSVCGLKKLRVLDMSYSALVQLPEDFGRLQSLTEVYFTGCKHLEKLPDSFSELFNLERLDLSWCKNLQKLPRSVCGLKKLRLLNMSYSSLVQLPEDFGQLQSLTEIDFSECKHLEKLPDSFSELSNLERLYLSGCWNLQKLPPSVCGLKKLKVLDMRFSASVQLPQDFSQLQSLTEIDFHGCKDLVKLPDSFSELSNLERLDLSWCKNLQKLPPVCGLKKLRVLDMSYSVLVQLPEDFGRLQSLTEVYFNGCKHLEKLPDSFSELSNLERLDLSGCWNLQKLPRSVCGLKKLRVLNMRCSALVQLPEDFSQLQNLTEIDFSDCKHLEKLPDSFSELSNLERLDLCGCVKLQWLPPKSIVKKLRVLRICGTSIVLPKD